MVRRSTSMPISAESATAARPSPRWPRWRLSSPTMPAGSRSRTSTCCSAGRSGSIRKRCSASSSTAAGAATVSSTTRCSSTSCAPSASRSRRSPPASSGASRKGLFRRGPTCCCGSSCRRGRSWPMSASAGPRRRHPWRSRWGSPSRPSSSRSAWPRPATSSQLEICRGAAWVPLYRFSLEAQHPIDLDLPNWYVATHPGSLFVHHLLAARPTRSGRHGLFDCDYTLSRPDWCRRGEAPRRRHGLARRVGGGVSAGAGVDRAACRGAAPRCPGGERNQLMKRRHLGRNVPRRALLYRRWCRAHIGTAGSSPERGHVRPHQAADRRASP